MRRNRIDSAVLGASSAALHPTTPFMSTVPSKPRRSLSGSIKLPSFASKKTNSKKALNVSDQTQIALSAADAGVDDALAELSVHMEQEAAVTHHGSNPQPGPSQCSLV